MKYDDMIAKGAWTGKNLDLRARMAAYDMDGQRLGAIEWSTRSDSPDDTLLDQRSNEILGVALVLGLLGHDKVRITSFDSFGKKLERPDLDVVLSGDSTVGVEQADAVNTPQRQHEAETTALTSSIRNLLDTDAVFASAFGNHHIIIFLSSHVVGKYRIESKKERLAIKEEIERFIRSRSHVTSKNAETFTAQYPVLHSHGATWHSTSSDIPYFDIGHGATNVSAESGIPDIERVLDSHRKAASGYRSLPLWIILLLTDRWEFLRKTLDAVATVNPKIDPFERCYLADDSGRVLELQSGTRPAFKGMFIPGS